MFITSTKYISFISLFILLCLTNICFAYDIDGTQFDLYGKIGKTRNIGHIDLLVPAIKMEQTIIFINVKGMLDNKDSREINVGGGFRYAYDDYIIGIYGFYDYRHTTFNTAVKQFTFGGEWLTELYEIRTNFYLPDDKKTIVGQSTTSETTYDGNRAISKTMISDVVVTPLAGFDIEGGFSIPQFRQISTFLSYYHFSAKNIAPLNGIRNRSIFQITRFLALEEEASYDEMRHLQIYVGLKITLKLGNDNYSSSKVHNKIYQPPIRDIDAITTLSSVPNTLVIDNIYRN